MKAQIDWNSSIRDFSRVELAELSQHEVRRSLGYVTSDPMFAGQYTHIIPCEHGAMSAMWRDAGGLAATVGDILSVADAITAIPILTELIFGGARSPVVGQGYAHEWYNEIWDLMRGHKIRSACSVIADSLEIMVINLGGYSVENAEEMEELTTTLSGFAESFRYGPDESGRVLSDEQAAWWGVDKILSWDAAERQFLGVKYSGFPSAVNMAVA